MNFGPNTVMWIAISVIVVAAFVFRFLEQGSRDRTLRALAEKGQPIPPELLRYDGRGSRSGGGSIRAGLILMAIGAGVAIMFWGMQGYNGSLEGMAAHGAWLPTIGAIPFLIGVALFLSGLFDRRPPRQDG
jgi:hypothetical protein